jgi:hypothetical protein
LQDQYFLASVSFEDKRNHLHFVCIESLGRDESQVAMFVLQAGFKSSPLPPLKNERMESVKIKPIAKSELNTIRGAKINCGDLRGLKLWHMKQ